MTHRVVLNAVAATRRVNNHRWETSYLSTDDEERCRSVAEEVHGSSGLGGTRTVVERERDLSWCGPSHSRCGEWGGHDRQLSDLNGLSATSNVQRHRWGAVDSGHGDECDRDRGRHHSNGEPSNTQFTSPVDTSAIVV